MRSAGPGRGPACAPGRSGGRYDDTRFARLSAVDLTTASQDTTALGRRAVAAAVRRIEQPGLPRRRVAVEPRLIVRSSTGPPPAGR